MSNGPLSDTPQHHTPQPRNINLRYVDETYDAQGVIETFSLRYPDNFNFGYDIVDDIAVNDPDRRAMIWCNPEGEEHIFTFGEMKLWSDKTANYLASLGIGAGDMVMVIVRRHYQFWFLSTALHKLGAICVPATFMLKEHDLEYRLNSASIKAIVCTSVGEIAQVVDNVAADCPSVETKILLNGGGGGTVLDPEAVIAQGLGPVLSGPEGICALPGIREGWHDFNTGVREASAEFTRRETRVADPCLLYFSSGTTGNPKMVLHDGAYPLAHIPTAKHWHNVSQDHGASHFTIADTGWGKAVWGKLYGQWAMEACVFTYDFDRYVPAEILALIERYGITTLCCPPTMYRMMMGQGIDGYDLSSLTYCTTAGEALNPDLFEGWREHTGLALTEGFGQTETPLLVCNTPGMVPKPGSMGKPSPQYIVEIQNEEGERCAPGQTGEIVVKIDPKPEGVMMEYYRAPEKTAEAMHDGWYHTGDLSWYDEDGYFWYVGRNDDVIKSSGYRIGPFEIESVLLEHAAVAECAITGVPDPVRGLAVKATIVLAAGAEASDTLVTELQSWVKDRTAPYKYPRIIAFVPALPKTVNGKVRRAEIRRVDAEAAAGASGAASSGVDTQ